MITLLQLLYFQKLAVNQHVTNTAKELYISQTALSSMIKGLETELGIALFDRSKRSIKLNEAGQIYLKYVNDVFAALDNGAAALKDIAQSHERKISIAMGTTKVWVPLLQSFLNQYPDCTVKQSNLSQPELEKALVEFGVDFVIAGKDDIDSRRYGLLYEKVKDDRIFLCVSKKHRFAGRDSVYMSEIISEPFISLSDRSPWQISCNEILRQAGCMKRAVIECDYTMRSSLIEANFGVALTTSSAKEVDLLNPNVYIPIADEHVRREMGIFWNPKKYMSESAKSFRDFCCSFWKESENA